MRQKNEEGKKERKRERKTKEGRIKRIVSR